MGIAVPKPAPKKPKPRKRVKATNPRRRQSEFARCYHSRERVEWVRSQPCVVCGWLPSFNAHIVTGGTGRKARYDKIISLCFGHHENLHRYGVESFENDCALNLAALAAETERRWLTRRPANVVELMAVTEEQGEYDYLPGNPADYGHG